MPAETPAQERYWRYLSQRQQAQEEAERKEPSSPYTGVQREVQQVRRQAEAHPERAIIISLPRLQPPPSQYAFVGVPGQPKPPTVAEKVLWERVFKPEREAEEAQVRQKWQREVSQAETVSSRQFEKQVVTAKAEAKVRGVPESQIEAWETEQWRLYEAGVAGWREKEEAKYGVWVEAWRKEWKPKGVAERLLPQFTYRRLEPRLIGFAKQPFAPVAGIVASVESFAYGVAQVGGYRTPRVPPTVTGAGVSDVVAMATGKPAKATQRLLEEYPREYVGGTVIGDVLVSIGLGKALHKAGEEWLTYKYYKQPATWKGLPEKVIMKVTGAKPRLAYGETAIPGIIQRGPFELEVASMRASYQAFEMTVSPRMGGVWVGKYVPTIKMKKLPHLFISVSKGFAVKTTFQEYSFVREPRLTPLVTQQQLTRMGVYPHAPKEVSAGVSRAMSGVGVGVAETLVTGTLKAPEKPERAFPSVAVPKLFQPTFAYERLKYSPIQPLAPRQKERPVLAPVPAVAPAQAPAVAQATKQVVKLVPAMKVPTMTVPRVPTPQVPKAPPILPIVPPFMWFGGGRPFRYPRGKDLFGKWFLREHPIKPPKEMLRTFGMQFGLGPRKRRKKRKSRRRSRRGVMYPYAVFLLALVAMAFFWFVYYTLVSEVRGAVVAQMQTLEHNSTSDIFNLADTFTFNMVVYFLAFVVIGLLLWGIVYSQRKGREVAYY